MLKLFVWDSNETRWRLERISERERGERERESERERERERERNQSDTPLN